MKKSILFILSSSLSCVTLFLIASTAGLAQISPNPETLPGTKPLTWAGDLSVKMMDGAHRYIEKKIDQSIVTRQKYWHRDLSSKEAYQKSIEPNRNRFKQYIGAVDPRVPPVLQRIREDSNSEKVAETDKYSIYQVRWSVLENVYGEGLMLVPKTKPIAYVVAIPDADNTPEQITGLEKGIPPESQYARRLVENGFQVMVPMLISRSYEFSGHQYQTHREWIYRQAYQMGRHIIGYEVQKVLAAVDWFKKSGGENAKIGVMGYGEGGLIAFYAAAIDTRIDAALISGYFQSRQKVWDEPIYRNVWALLQEFGDAEIATLIAPRSLIIEYSQVPEVIDQPEALRQQPLNLSGFIVDGYKGKLQTPLFRSVKEEFTRIDQLIKPSFQTKHLVSNKDKSPIGPGSAKALELFANQLGVNSSLVVSVNAPVDHRNNFNALERQHRQFQELENHVQSLIKNSPYVRDDYFLYKAMPEFEEKEWSTALTHKTYPPEKFVSELPEYRKYLWDEVLGRFDEDYLPFNPRTRKVYDNPKWTGYEVVLDVYPEVFVWGILLIPKDIKEGEQRPLVVCQHGRNGLPTTAIEVNSSYFGMAGRLAERGFIAFTPHNLYRGEDRYRWLDRKANNVKASLFSFILAQHDQMLKWLEKLHFVDGKRMAFYGKSYGGETAMRVPPLLDRYCLSICAGDFDDWAVRMAGTTPLKQFSELYSIEWEMPYFNMGNTFNYAELAYLMVPRPFMVERGHHDTVSPDDRVAYEYAKVRWLYAQLELSDKTAIEFFNGGHAINAKGTFSFLHKHLNWPEPKN